MVNTPAGSRWATTEPPISAICSRSPSDQPNASIVARLDTTPQVSIRPMPYTNAPARGRGSRSATSMRLVRLASS
jgi:hypothetical protein